MLRRFSLARRPPSSSSSPSTSASASPSSPSSSLSSPSLASAFSSSSPLLTVEFDSPPPTIVTAGSTLSGVVHLSPTASATVLERVTVKLRGVLVCSYRQLGHGGQANGLGATKDDHRYETTTLLEEELVLWPPHEATWSLAGGGRADACIDDDDDDGPRRMPKAATAPPAEEGSEQRRLPWAFHLPTLEDQHDHEEILPPSFDAGRRGIGGSMVGKSSIEGTEVGRVVYYIKVTGFKSGRVSINERVVLPFVYTPPSTISPFSVPATLVSPPTDPSVLPPFSLTQLPIHLLPSLSSPSWRTHTTSATYRPTPFHFLKKSTSTLLSTLSLTLPALPSYPIAHSIPYVLRLTILGPLADSPSSPAPASLLKQQQLDPVQDSLPQFTLWRSVLTRAQEAGQTLLQPCERSQVVDFHGERRIWRGECTYREREGGGGGRWGFDIVVVGEMRFEGRGVVPSFGKDEDGSWGAKAAGPGVGKYGNTAFGQRGSGGALGCDYFLGVKIPLRGLITSTHDVDDFVSLSLSSQVNEGFAEAEKTTDASADAAFPPSYYEAVGMDVVDGKEGSGFDEGVRLF